ncbi:MAG TPA: hypothetical protein VHD15_16690 [Hyphomicrobiales bacterium]|nr:hypothetical protein [Hyphomicrobiales bacterium]
MSKPSVYVVQFWADPKYEQPLMAWLDGGHMAEVASQPGFLGARRIRLDASAAAADGWQAHMMIYEIESRQALEAYFARADLAARFAEERRAFQHALRIERVWGDVELAVGLNAARAGTAAGAAVA